MFADAAQNAQKYFKLYNKAKTAEEVLTQQIEQAQPSWIIWKVSSLLSAKPKTSVILHSCARSSRSPGVLSAKQTRNKKMRGKPVQAKPFHYRTSDGFDVFAGKTTCRTIF